MPPSAYNDENDPEFVRARDSADRAEAIAAQRYRTWDAMRRTRQLGRMIAEASEASDDAQFSASNQPRAQGLSAGAPPAPAITAAPRNQNNQQEPASVALTIPQAPPNNQVGEKAIAASPQAPAPLAESDRSRIDWVESAFANINIRSQEPSAGANNNSAPQQADNKPAPQQRDNHLVREQSNNHAPVQQSAAPVPPPHRGHQVQGHTPVQQSNHRAPGPPLYSTALGRGAYGSRDLNIRPAPPRRTMNNNDLQDDFIGKEAYQRGWGLEPHDRELHDYNEDVIKLKVTCARCHEMGMACDHEYPCSHCKSAGVKCMITLCQLGPECDNDNCMSLHTHVSMPREKLLATRYIAERADANGVLLQLVQRLSKHAGESRHINDLSSKAKQEGRVNEHGWRGSMPERKMTMFQPAMRKVVIRRQHQLNQINDEEFSRAMNEVAEFGPNHVHSKEEWEEQPMRNIFYLLQSGALAPLDISNQADAERYEQWRYEHHLVTTGRDTDNGMPGEVAGFDWDKIQSGRLPASIVPPRMSFQEYVRIPPAERARRRREGLGFPPGLNNQSSSRPRGRQNPQGQSGGQERRRQMPTNEMLAPPVRRPGK